MTTIPRRPWRLWAAELALALLLALLLRACALDAAAGPVSVAFIGLWSGIVAVASTLWKIGSTAVTVAIKYAIVGLRWAVNNLTKLIVSGLKKSAVFIARNVMTLGRFIRTGFVALVRNMQRAALWLRGTLTNIFGPVLRFLDRVKGYVRKIYDRFVRPVLDFIEITRRIFRLLGYLGIDWARAIDRALGRLENIITLPFDWLVGKINELIGLVNRIITVDGLLQRVMLINSLLRDVTYTNRIFWNSQSTSLSSGQIEAAKLRHAFPDPEDYDDELKRYLETRSGPMAPVVDEMIADSVLIGERLRGRR
jgi:hypothetical protein